MWALLPFLNFWLTQENALQDFWPFEKLSSFTYLFVPLTRVCCPKILEGSYGKHDITYSKGTMVPTMVPTMKPPLKPQTDSKNESVSFGRPCESTPCKLTLQLSAHQVKKPGMALHPICNLCTVQQASKQQASICMVGRSREALKDWKKKSEIVEAPSWVLQD